MLLLPEIAAAWMKVTLINTTDAGGGAPEACRRLLRALEQAKVEVLMLVQRRLTRESRIHFIVHNLVNWVWAQFTFFYERLPFIFIYARDKSVRFAFSTAPLGKNITNHLSVIGADILHLHWTNSGFLSIENIKQLINLNKPVVWTLHDMWAFTGGCHYSGTCDHYLRHCGNCHFLSTPGAHDISNGVWKRKHRMLVDADNVVFVACSNWLAGIARKSDLLHSFRIEVIPNPIDTTIFEPKDKLAARQKHGIGANTKVVLFGAANVADKRKGLIYLMDALEHLKQDYPESKDIEIVVFGKNRSFDFSVLPYKVHELPVIRSQREMAELYSLADVFVSPAIEDNLPNMVMESLACGTPVVCFNAGGVVDMVEHLQNGYLADYKSAPDLAKGINHVLHTGSYSAYSNYSREKVLTNFTNELVAAKYIALYQSL